MAVLFGYAISGERTLEAFYQRLHPFAQAFMALFGRERLPARSTLSRFLAALSPEPVEALRSLFLSDLLARSLVPEEQPVGLWDRTESQWFVFDIDGTREGASPRALPQIPDLSAPERRLRPLCAPGYTGRKRGEVVRSRTTILQAHTHQWLGSFGGAGNGKPREELRRAVAQIQRYLAAHQLRAERVRLAARRAIWHRSHPLGSSGLALRHAWQRLPGAFASPDPVSALSSLRSAVQPPGERFRAHPL